MIKLETAISIEPRRIDNLWQAHAWQPSLALVTEKLRVNDSFFRELGYRRVAEAGHRLADREDFLPEVIQVVDDLFIIRLKAGYRGMAYFDDDDLLYKTNYSGSVEVKREYRIWQRACAQLASTRPDYLATLEECFGQIVFEPTESPLINYRLDPEFGHLIRPEVVLIKRFIKGQSLSQIIESHAGHFPTSEDIYQLARLFEAIGSSGVLLQSDPSDFILDQGGIWRAIDADGWMLYETNDAYCAMASKRNFKGTFTREWGEGAEGRAALVREDKSAVDQMIRTAQEMAELVWGDVESRYQPKELHRALETEDLLAPKDARLRSLIRVVLDDPLVLDSELGSCTFNVLLSTNELLQSLMGLRGTESLTDFYFGDIEQISGTVFCVLYSPYNDEFTTGDHAANHTGITNHDIADRVLNAAEGRLA